MKAMLEEIKKIQGIGHNDFDTIIQRNIKLSEAPSFQLPVVMYDAESKGALCYMQLAKEFLDKNELDK